MAEEAEDDELEVEEGDGDGAAESPTGNDQNETPPVVPKEPVRKVKIGDLDLKNVADILASGMVPVAVPGVDTFRVPLAQIVGAAPPGSGHDPDPGNGEGPNPNAPVNAEAPVIRTQPSDALYMQNGVAAPLMVFAEATDGGVLSYQWYKISSNPVSSNTAVGGNSNTYTPATSAVGEERYYAEVTSTIVDNGDGGAKTATTFSNIATIAVAQVSGGELFGVKWRRYLTDTSWVRTRDSANFTFTPKINGVGGSSSFDDKSIYRDIRLVHVVNGEIVSEEGDPLFNRNPANGDIMVKIPRFYYDIISTANDMEIVISDQPFPGSKVSPRHAPHAGAPNGYDYILVSAYTLDDNYRSKSGNQSKVSITRAAARTGIHGRGAKYWQYDLLTYRTICLLYLVEAANWDSQEVVGKGYTGGSAQQNTGGADNIGYHSGSTVASNVATGIAKYRHMENLWGNIWQWVDGINFNDARTYIAANPSQYADDTVSNYTELSYTKAAANGYQKDIGFDPDFPFAMVPTDTAGAEGQYIADYYYQGAGWGVCRVGGDWGNGAYAGLFDFSSSVAATYSGTGIGCRLLVLP